MEQGKGSPSGQRNPRSNSVVNPVEQQQPYAAPERTRDQDYLVPMSNITRVMRKAIPQQAKIADDAKETVQHCITEYINMVTSEATERCRLEKRKTVTADDIMWAIERLGFDDYVGPLSLYLKRFRESQRDWKEEALGRRVVDYGRLPPPTAVLLLPAVLKVKGEASGASTADANHAMGKMKLGYYKDNGGEGSSSSTNQDVGAQKKKK